MCVTSMIVICHMTHSYVYHVWHDSFIRVPWLVHTCDMTHWDVCHDVWCVSLVLRICDRWHMHSHVSLDPFTSLTWLLHVSCMTHSYLWHDSFLSVTWLIPVCDMTHSDVCLTSSIGHTAVWPFMCVTCFIHVCGIPHWYLSHTSSTYVPWLIHMCGMTHSYAPWLMDMWHDSIALWVQDACLHSTHTHTHTHTHTQPTHIYVCIFVYTYVFAYIHIHTHTSIYVRAHLRCRYAHDRGPGHMPSTEALGSLYCQIADVTYAHDIGTQERPSTGFSVSFLAHRPEHMSERTCAHMSERTCHMTHERAPISTLDFMHVRIYTCTYIYICICI